MSHIHRIASRDSSLALWQTNAVMASLKQLGYPCELIPLKTLGDINLVEPLYAMGVQGVFTKELDTALLNNQADIAVHSLKDVPTVLPKGLMIAAVLERASNDDILVHREGFDPAKKENAVIATSSIRRKSQWLKRYPTHQLVNVRGNVGTRLKKFEDEGWDGIIFAKAGLERLNLLPKHFTVLNWMLSAPAQGTIAIVCRKEDKDAVIACKKINHEPTEICISVERDFLFHLEGGCSVPISALAKFENEHIHFEGLVSSLDGTRELKVTRKFLTSDWKKIGKAAADAIRQSNEGKLILDEFRKLNRNTNG
ncbi:MAG TPA: hydroxymethylbilane synthase [Cytophagales bacterium]|nr:hydroxymethylbilane synthase [Cytophagales bacterium]